MYMPVISEKECTNCQACARICPKLVLEADRKKVSVGNACLCTGCESCRAVCPLNAIKVEEI
jgi:Pyruvate/2-oxoacid:ferredoxin oxidoreductase delta subunit